ncbi:hypothetical protein K438DRAFT_2021557 [Mycena galopus ATCC 62051]|nr:hypothetical protein K438DRAFT_2021557 [Mycena galopus ATCC 62051]
MFSWACISAISGYDYTLTTCLCLHAAVVELPPPVHRRLGADAVLSLFHVCSIASSCSFGPLSAIPARVRSNDTDTFTSIRFQKEEEKPEVYAQPAAPVTRQPTDATHEWTSSKTQDNRGQGLCVALEKPLTPPLVRYPPRCVFILLALDASLESLVEAAAAPVPDSEKKKRKKVRKETFSFDTHNGVFLISSDLYRLLLSAHHTHSGCTITARAPNPHCAAPSSPQERSPHRFSVPVPTLSPTGSLSFPCRPSPPPPRPPTHSAPPSSLRCARHPLIAKSLELPETHSTPCLPRRMWNASCSCSGRRAEEGRGGATRGPRAAHARRGPLTRARRARCAGAVDRRPAAGRAQQQ